MDKFSTAVDNVRAARARAVPGAKQRTDRTMTLVRVAAIATVAAYVKVRYRIRGFGHLPRSRGATLVVANAQSEADDTAMVPLLTFDGSLRRPVYAIASRRLFEPGFLAVRIPWLARVLYRADFSRLFSAIAIMPIENELTARPLRSIAAALCDRDGRVPLRRVLDDRARVRLAIGAQSVDDVFAWRSFRLAGAYVRMRELREPYRSRIMTATRRQVDADVAALEHLLDGGATAYLVPEGRFQAGGRIERFGRVIEGLAPRANTIACGISYDPFRSGRLSFLYRLLPVGPGTDFYDALRVARPVTISQIVALRLFGGSATFSRDAFERDVASVIASLPPGLLRDPELTRATTLADALGTLLRCGLVLRDGDGYHLTGERNTAQFATMRDQAQTLVESIDAARRLARPAHSSPSK